MLTSLSPLFLGGLFGLLHCFFQKVVPSFLVFDNSPHEEVKKKKEELPCMTSQARERSFTQSVSQPRTRLPHTKL